MSNYRIIDISQWMGDFDFPGNGAFRIMGPFNRVEGSNPEFVYDVEMCTQSGTHVQGPHYFLETGRRIDAFPLESFEGEAILVDMEKRGIDTTRDELFEKIAGENLAGKILVLRTGNMEEIVATGEIDPKKRPGLSLEAAEYLAEQRVKMIAIDSVGLESRMTSNYEVNKYLCSRGVLILEGLINLSAIPGRRFFLEAFPLKIRNVEGTPCRAIAKVPI